MRELIIAYKKDSPSINTTVIFVLSLLEDIFLDLFWPNLSFVNKNKNHGDNNGTDNNDDDDGNNISDTT